MEITGWKEHHKAQIQDMLRAYLKSQLKMGGDTAATPKNVNWFWELGMYYSQHGQPTYAAVENGRVLSIVLCGEPVTDLDTAFSTVTIYAAYTLPSQEHKFLYVTLIREVRDYMVEHKVTRLGSLVLLQNTRNLEILFKGDVWPYAVCVAWMASEFDTGANK